MISDIRKKLQSLRPVLTAACLILLTALTVWILWGNTALTATGLTLSSDRLPASFDGFRIAHVSDLHNAVFGKENERLLSLIADGNPDIIAITGDLLESGSRRMDMEAALSFAGEAAKLAPTYYVTGNHESYISNQYETLKEGLMARGVTVLSDEAVPFHRDGETIWLLGLEDPAFTVKSSLLGETSAMTAAKLKKLTADREGYTVLLCHRPELFDVYTASGIDLALTGHAHGGQFRLPLIGGLFAPDQGLFPKYDAGLFTEGRTNMVVSRGLGNSVILLRFNNRPEILFIELTR